MTEKVELIFHVTYFMFVALVDISVGSWVMGFASDTPRLIAVILAAGLSTFVVWILLMARLRDLLSIRLRV
jgi:hypothetical protein